MRRVLQRRLRSLTHSPDSSRATTPGARACQRSVRYRLTCCPQDLPSCRTWQQDQETTAALHRRSVVRRFSLRARGEVNPKNGRVSVAARDCYPRWPEADSLGLLVYHLDRDCVGRPQRLGLLSATPHSLLGLEIVPKALARGNGWLGAERVHRRTRPRSLPDHREIL